MAPHHKWMSIAETNQMLDDIKQQALSIITGAINTTRIKAMEYHLSVTRETPKHTYRPTSTSSCQITHCDGQIEDFTKYRPRRTNFIHETKRFTKANIAKLGPPVNYDILICHTI